MFRNTSIFSILFLSTLLLTQCQNKPVTSNTQTASASTKEVEETEYVPYNKVEQEDSKIEPDEKQITAKKESKSQKEPVIHELVLDIDQTYVPVVETCVYIRSAPNLDNSTIIQCLIPERTAEYVTGMAHHLKPTGNTDGDWGEFEYWFDIYTNKLEPQDTIDVDIWTQKKDEAHEAAKKKYRTFRKNGWLKYKNNDGTSKIKLVEF